MCMVGISSCSHTKVDTKERIREFKKVEKWYKWKK